MRSLGKYWRPFHSAILIVAIIALSVWPQSVFADSTNIDFEDPPYSTGSIHNQDGWSSSGPFDQEVFAHSLYPPFGNQSLRISNAVTSDSFGDQTFAKPLADAVGEVDATVGAFSEGTRQNHFEMQFDIASAQPGSQQAGLFLSVSPDRGDGSRMSYLNFTDGPSGINVSFYDVQGTTNPANFVQTVVATGLDRTQPHTIRLVMLALDGPSNDVVEVYINGQFVHKGTSWENYYRYDSEASAEQSPRIVKSVIFRASGTPVPATAGNGFLIDNLALTSSLVTQCTTTCYVDTVNGSNTFGGTSPIDAKKAIQAAVDQVAATGNVIVAPGIYNENVLINKSLTLEGAGAGTDSSLHTIIDGNTSAILTGAGISLANGITDVTIRDLRVQDFTGTGGGGIRGLGNNNNNLLVEDVHVDNNGVVGIAGGGIYLNGPVNNVTINNVRATNNKSRGIVIWNGFKQNITITNNYVANNNCCGIELQDGTASGVTVTGNVVENNADSGMAMTGLTSGAGPNVISGNHLLNNGRFGLEIKLPDGSGAETGDGSIVVSGNFITQTTLSGSEERDLAGIAVYRRGMLVGNTNNNVNIPVGVVVKENTVTGIQQSNVASDSEGFCIVVEGNDMKVLSNTVTSCDVGIQIQAGHDSASYVPNNAGDGNQNDLADTYFGRGNSPVASGLIHYNYVAGNTVGIRNVGAAGNIDARANWYNAASGPGPVGPGIGDSVSSGLTFCPWLDDVPGVGQLTRGIDGLVTTTNDALPFCTIQAAVDASINGSIVEVSDGTYTENVVVNKSLTLRSLNGRDQTTIVGISNVGALGAVRVTNNTDGFVIDGFTIEGIDNNAPGIENAAIYFQGSHTNAQILNNRINANGDLALVTEFAAVISHFLIDNNIFGGQTFTGTPAGQGFSQQFTLANVPRQLVAMGGGAGGGNTSNITFTNNHINGVTGGINGLSQEQGNTLVTIDANGATITGNTFAGTTTLFGNSLRTRGPNTVISGNTFSNVNMGVNTGHLFIQNHPVGLPTVIANNTFNDGAFFANGDGTFYNGINIAIANAPGGETVEIFAGTYTETVTLKSSVNVEGASESTVVIHGSLVVPSPLATVNARNFTVHNGSTTSYLLDMRNAGAITDVVFEHVTFELVGDFLPVNGPGTFSTDAPIGNSYARPSFELIDGDADNAGLTFRSVTMDSGDFKIGTANEIALLFFKSTSGAKLLLDDLTLRGLNTATANLGAQFNTSPGAGQTAHIEIINSTTEVGGNFYVSGFDSAVIKDNVFNQQGLALNGVKNASVMGNTFQNIDNTLTANGTQHRGLTIEDAWGTSGIATLNVSNNIFNNITAPDGAIAFQRFTSPPSDLASLARLQDVLVKENTFTSVDTPVFLNATFFGANAILPMELMTVPEEPEQFAIGTPAIDTFILAGSINDYSYTLRDFPGYIHGAIMITPTLGGDPVLLFAIERLQFDDEGLLFVAAAGTGAPFNAIQPAIDAALDGDLILVYPNNYNETATGRSVLGNGSYQFGLFIDKNDLTIQGVDANGNPITDPLVTEAKIKTNATNNFGHSGIFVHADNVTLAGLAIQENAPSNNKTIEIIGDGFVLKDSHIDVEPDGSNIGGAVYFGDWQYDTGTNTSYIQSYAITNNLFDHGAQVAISSGAGHSGAIANRVITNNVFLIMGRGGPAISFNGAGGVPWYAHPVGAATITGNDFSGGGVYVRARGDYDNAGMNWTGIWDNNDFDRAVVTLVGDFATPFDVRAYSYISGPYTFTNVRMIGGTIQPHISEIGQPDDTVFVDEGIYPENIVYNKAVNLKGSGGGDAEVCGVGDPDTQTIITAPSGHLIQLSASGPSSANKLLIEDIRLELQSTTTTQYGIGVATNVDNIKLENVRIIGTDASTLSSQRGLVVNSAPSITNWEIVDSSFNCLFVGVWFAKESAAAASAQADNIVVTGSDFRGNGIKGMYVEKLSNATIDNNEFVDNSAAIDKVSLGATHSAGLDINLKFGAYTNISVTNNTFTGNGIGATEGGALMIKARDDGSYSSLAASLTNVTVTTNTVTGNERGIRFGEPNQSNAGPSQVNVNHNTIVTNTQTVAVPGTTYGGIIDWTASPSIAVNRNALYDNTTWNIAEANGGAVDGTCNWYGTSVGPGSTVASTVPFSPWLITSNLDGDCVLGTIAVNVAVVGSTSYAPATWAITSTLGNFAIPQSGGTETFPNLGVGTYVFTQTVDPDYTVVVDCGNGVESSAVVTLTLAMAENASCTFTNTLKPATLTVIKNVINNHGGTATVSNFNIFVNGSQVNSGEVNAYVPGSYIVTESGVPNYSSLISGDCAANGLIVLDPGMDYTCTITNDDLVQGTLNLSKIVVGSSAFAPSGGWQFYLDSTLLTIPASGGGALLTDIPPGTYTVSEVVDSDYDVSFSCGGPVTFGNSTQITVTLGQVVSCTFTNTVKSATLTVVKSVINDNGGNATVDDFPLFVNGNPVTSSVAISVAPGIHIVTEDAGTYTGSFGGDCAANGTISIAAGESKTCTITNNDPAQGTLNLTKVVVGGTASAPAGGWQFFLGDTPILLPVAGGSVQLTDVPVGSYVISEVIDSDYSTSLSCGSGATLGSSTLITFTLGQTVSCTFTNTVKSATLTVNKVVINDNGGTAVAGDFPLFVDGAPINNGVAFSVTPGIHTVSENAGNYIGSFSGDCSANGTVSLLPGESKTCTLTNNDPGQGTLNLTKVVVGSNAFAPAGGWQFTLGDLDITLPAAGGNQLITDIAPGVYTLTEEAADNYTTVINCGAGTVLGNSTPITFTLGQAISCVVTNTVGSATLTVTKVVVNDDGGTAVVADFNLFVSGTPVTSGVANTFTPGTYVISEDNFGGYSATFSGDCAANGTVSLAPGENKSCTITNNDPNQGTINITNLVVGSSDYAPAGGWTFALDATQITIPVGGGATLFTNIAPGTYTISQEADPDYVTTVNCGNGTTTATSTQVTLVLGQGVGCQFTNTLRDSTLVVNKVVINDDGGTAVIADFPLFVNGSPVTGGISNTLAPGTYTVSENNLGNYSPTFSGDCAANGVVILVPGEAKSCTITNDDIAVGEKIAAISLVKTVGVIEGVCATATAIAVLSGETVYYCYTITNNGNVTLTEHTLVDSRLGTLINAIQTDIAPGQTITSVALAIEATDVIEAPTVSSATWTAVATNDALIANASATTTVTLGIEDYQLTVQGTYIPPSGGGTTGGQMIYDINVLNTGTAILKNLQLTFIVPAGTTFAAGEDAWSCADGAPAGSVCTLVIDVLNPGEDVDIVLNLNIIAEIDINQLTLELNAESEGTPTSPTSGRGIVVVGPNATQRTFLFMPALGRTDEG